jgi:DNA-binding NarL/FixJ family response regulator
MQTLIHFSPRQEEVLSLIADGFTDKEIAVRLGLRQRTVRTHLERLYARHGLHNRAGALTIWLRSRGEAGVVADVGRNADL